MDEDDVYASILARVGRPELDRQLHTVLRKEYRSIGRQVDRVSSSLAAARQLQSAAEFLRPSGDWQPKTLQAQLKSIEQLQSSLETALNEIERRTKKKKKKRQRKRIAEREEDSERKTKAMEKEKLRDREAIVLDDDDDEEADELAIVENNASANAEEDSGVEFLQVVTPADRAADVRTGDAECEENDAVTVEKRCRPVDVIEVEEDACEVEILEVETNDEGIEEGGGLECVGDEGGGVECVEDEGAVLECSPEGSDGNGETNEEVEALPSGLMRRSRDEAVRVKEEVIDQQAILKVDRQEACEGASVDGSETESPMELEVPESSEESAVELEMSDSEQLAMELEVFDSDSDNDDDFSLCRELVDKLQNESDATHQLVVFPQTVAVLRSYLLDRKHLEVDEYLYAHKTFTDGELTEMGCAIETIASVGMDLPRQPRVKMALNDLLTLVEQLEHTLGELPTCLDPYVCVVFWAVGVSVADDVSVCLCAGL
ncbi:hypothetical protein PHYSODRAFT_305062 [Phytophthora sojae]|uniref:Uncharacterized protein n=1 Tax=Phytophthora sojae (strain P6497) TaxID=1094619 RepID=G5A4H6_PHYSP|nr:hypothetical protein PHYSODRAFT_305062 [Phytophthora sojae]EGZ09577.1 hypothetical protein PHYSODRAFT_305062 [Phytophthora sojae]|eukprot:XP_009534438.1 hypothetical protein PHYSODRAFT_305062 [Phytophthora sojae]